ncbi:hypothetical protein [Chromobacterium haemolyticum]|uniref:hypothetical protein n=1 Tax=Chromobacterium haemolyticum TaxID=394935 RepID=UPI0012DED222|nr:hypothetical protein [Chromobacterium haemolyticum]
MSPENTNPSNAHKAAATEHKACADLHLKAADHHDSKKLDEAKANSAKALQSSELAHKQSKNASDCSTK